MLGRLEIKDRPVSTDDFQKEEGLELEQVTQPPSTPLPARPGLRKGLVCPQCLLSFVEDQSTTRNHQRTRACMTRSDPPQDRRQQAQVRRVRKPNRPQPRPPEWLWEPRS